MGKKKVFSTRINEDSLKALKHLAVDTDKSLGELLEEAIKDICVKYEKIFSQKTWLMLHFSYWPPIHDLTKTSHFPDDTVAINMP